MIKLIASKPQITQNYMTNDLIISFRIDNASSSAVKASLTELDKDKYQVEIKEFRKKRSLDSNAYLWVLLNELSLKLQIPREEIYRNYIKKRGRCDIVCVQKNAADSLINAWQHNGIGWICEKEQSKIKDCVNVVLYYGSSIYDTTEMSDLLDEVVADCKEQGIETDMHMKILLEGGENAVYYTGY